MLIPRGKCQGSGRDTETIKQKLTIHPGEMIDQILTLARLSASQFRALQCSRKRPSWPQRPMIRFWRGFETLDASCVLILQFLDCYNGSVGRFVLKPIISGRDRVNKSELIDADC